METKSNPKLDPAPLAEAPEDVVAGVIDALADATDTDPLAMDPPLYSVVDTDALNQLFQSGVDGWIRFDYNGHVVSVQGDGTVSVDGITYVQG